MASLAAKPPKTLDQHYRIYRKQFVAMIGKLCININIYAGEKTIGSNLCQQLSDSTMSLMDYYVSYLSSKGMEKPFDNQQFIMTMVVCFWIIMKFSMDDCLDSKGVLKCFGTPTFSKKNLAEKELEILDSIDFNICSFMPKPKLQQTEKMIVYCAN